MEDLRTVVIHFQQRFILCKNPEVKTHLILDLLFRISCNESCIEDYCSIIKYLDCNLPKVGKYKIPLNCIPEKIKVGPCGLFQGKIIIITRGNEIYEEFTLEELVLEKDGYYFYPELLESRLSPSDFPALSVFYRILNRNNRKEEEVETETGFLRNFNTIEDLKTTKLCRK